MEKEIKNLKAFGKLKTITPEDLWSENKQFQPKTISGLRSMESGLSYTVLEDKKRIDQYSYENGEKTGTLFDVEWLKPKKIREFENYDLSSDESRILIATQVEKIYRHSFSAKYFVWDINSRTISRLSERPKQRLAVFSPDGNKVAFVSRNNLFIKDLLSGKERQITTDGKINSIINGAADWVYEEEFGLKRAFEWSPDGSYIAYLRFDESKVKQFTMQRFNSGYPELVTYKYPRAGEQNSVVSVHVYELKTGRTVIINTGSETDQYIPCIKWAKKPGELIVLRVNRLQNKLDFLIADAQNGSTRLLLTEENERYLDADNDFQLLGDGKHLLRVSEKSGWRHVHLYSMDGKEIKDLTNGNWDITEFHGFNEENGRVYFTAARPTALKRTLYSVKLDGTDEKKLSTDEGCNSTVFSNGLRYYINTHTSANTPPVITLHTADGKLVRVLEDNAELRTKLQQYRVPKKEFFKFTTSEGIELNGWMMKPLDFRENNKYPVLMTVYGGPNSQTVTDSWHLGWESFLTQYGLVIASIDGRGTGGRGEDFRKCTYLQLGKYEVADQIEGARYLGSLPYIDESRIGIFGWSYGGFMASGCILRGADVFKASVAVASVTNFRYYDTVYTERYMRTPQENPDGYDQNAPITYADNLKGRLLLVHGVMDDNVHYQNSLELVEALIKSAKDFEVHFIPNRAHGISGGNAHLHLYKRMTDFLLKNL